MNIPADMPERALDRDVFGPEMQPKDRNLPARMKIGQLADAVGRSTPAVMTLQKKFALTVFDDYAPGYVVLLRKIIYLDIFSVPTRDIKALVEREKGLLELLKVDSLHNQNDWFESICTLRSGPTRLLLTGHDIGHPVHGNAVQTGLDFHERERELFNDHEMGADALKGLQRYAETLERVHRKMAGELPIVRAAETWLRGVGM